MQKREIGSSGIKASAVALGTWAIGGWMWGGSDEAESVKAVRAAVDEGITLIDTAPIYGFGKSEEVVGKAVEGRRDEVVIATKCGLVWDTEKGDAFFENEGRKVCKYLGPESIKREVEQSLKRLRTDRIDLLQTHWQESTTPIAETMGALVELKQQGKVRALGVSNVNVEQLREYERAGKLDSDQERYSMLDRGIEEELLPECRKRRISMLAYSPLALGLLTGKIGPEREFPDDDLRHGNPRFSVENRKKVSDMLELFEPIAQAHDASIPQIVIAWTASQPGVDFVLCGSRRPEHAKENAQAGAIVLSEDELQVMSEKIGHYATDIP